VGGRYSIWSAIGLPLLLKIGPQHFQAFIEGAYEMDQHFRQTPFEKNMPVILALLSIWYRNFFSTQVEAIVPYTEHLRYLIPYLQQAEMESNGKSINLQGEEISYATGPVIFGDEGSNGQHAYHQLLHQGKHFVPVDFILLGKSKDDKVAAAHQDILIASGLSQAQALMRGKTYEEAYADLLAKQKPQAEAAWLAKHQIVPGNRPSNVLFLKRLTPYNLGALLALYEHKIFVQGIIWNINSFDQWGVELGKELLPAILRAMQDDDGHPPTDSATAGMIHHFKKMST
jgi:glucose-6-phosphate isomerase